MIKKLLYAVVGLVLLLVIGLVIAFLSIDSIAKAAIERGGTYALGTQTSVSSVSVGVFKGEFSLSGLNVANPTGGAGGDKFNSPHFLSLGKGATAVSLSTIRQPTVEIASFTLDNVDAYLEKRSGGTNYGAILDHLKQVTGGGDTSKPAPSSGDEKKFIIHELKITNVTVHVDMGAGVPNIPGGSGDKVASVTKVTVPIDRIELKDVGQTGTGVGGSGVTMSQLSAIIVKAVLSAAAERGGGIIPADMLGDLSGKLSALTSIDSLSKGGAAIIGDVKNKVADLEKNAEKDVKKGVDDAIKGILPGGKKK